MRQQYNYNTLSQSQLISTLSFSFHRPGVCYYHSSVSLSKELVPKQSHAEGSPALPVESGSFPMVRAKTSGRSQKRKKRRLQWRRARIATSQEDKSVTVRAKVHQTKVLHDVEDDQRTWKTILFPWEIDIDGTPKEPPVPWPTSPIVWYRAFQEAWADYSGTWEGFWSNLKSKDDATGKAQDEAEPETKTSATQQIADTTQQIADTASRNIEFSQTEGKKLLEEAKSRTGVYTVEDAKKLAREMMTVATAMLREFMIGYRTGRDEEVEKMLHEYFQEEEEEEENDEDKKQSEEAGAKRRKRRPKRRNPSSLTIY